MAQDKLANEMSNVHTTKVGSSKIGLIIGLWMMLLFVSANVPAQVTGTSSPQNKETENKADQNLNSIARVNPSTLAMEMDVPLTNYPGRNGSSLPVGFSYSSKLWRMQGTEPWWTWVNTQPYYITDIFPMFAEKKAAGWTSTLVPPRIEEQVQVYDANGQPYRQPIDGQTLSQRWNDILQSFTSNSNQETCNLRCEWWTSQENPLNPFDWVCMRYGLDPFCSPDPGGGGGGGNGQIPLQLYYVRRIQITMADGSTHEFRASDSPVNCGNTTTGCVVGGTVNGTYLAVDGSGMKLIWNDDGKSIFMPDGSRYVFPVVSPIPGATNYAEFIDVEGNKLTFSTAIDPSNGQPVNKWTDTIGREIIDPMSQGLDLQMQSNGRRDFSLPGMNGQPQQFSMTWALLKPRGCETSTDPNCIGTNNTVGGALENQSQKLFYDTRYLCRGLLQTDLLSNPNDLSDPANEVLFPLQDNGIRPCSNFSPQRDANGNVVLDENGIAIIEAPRFNRSVLTEVELPNGKKYEFKYNRFGEITKIIYPTGSYETFVYGHIEPISGTDAQAYDQTNRGVVERKTYRWNPNGGDGILEQRWQYSAGMNSSNGLYKVTTTAPKADNPLGNGIRTERYLGPNGSAGYNFGFDSPTGGMPVEERVFAENDQTSPRSRTLTEWTTKSATIINQVIAARDPRVKRTISITIENGMALATLNETEYDEIGDGDPAHFSHLNAIRSKSYHYAAIPLSLAENGTIAQIAPYFNVNLLASVSETDYEYDDDYMARGIPSLATKTRVINPVNNEIIAKTETVYDNMIPEPSSTYPSAYTREDYGIEASYQCPSENQTVTCWENPNSSRRGKPTTVRLWDSDNGIWHESHTRYDIFGNVVKVKDPAGNEATTVFEDSVTKPYRYAYPTSVVTPAPDPTNTHGTNQTSTTSSTYDAVTGLPFTVTDDLGRTTKTEYNDALLRPTRVFPLNFTAPEAQTIYDDTNLTVKVKKQIDETHWDEATIFLDSLGRTIKTQATDSQGDIFAETEFDNLGRVKRTTNPYRLNDPQIYWNRPRYDELSRTVETCAPLQLSEIPGGLNDPCPSGKSLGTVDYSFSTLTGFVGTVLTTTDASGRKSRSFTNALGQLIRVDESSSTKTLDPVPQSTPTANPSPSPTPIGGGGPTGCAQNCLTAADYPMNSTYYIYNPQGNLVRVIQGDQNRYFKYDSLGRLIRVMQPEQEPNPNLSLSDSYNTSGQWSAAFQYNALGDLVRATDANGVSIINEYDKAKRVTKRCYSKPNLNVTATTCAGLGANSSDNTPTVENFYDGFLAAGQPPTASPNYAKGKLTRVASSVSDTRYTGFDNLGRITESIQRTPFADNETVENATPRVSKYAYNFAGALIEETYPSTRVVRYEYESDGDLSRIWGKKDANAPERTYVNSFSFTASGGIERMKLGNGRWETAKFNERAQLTEIGIGMGANDNGVWKLQYKYGEFESGSVNTGKNTGNIAQTVMTVAGIANPIVQNYKYDSLYRLTEAEEKNNTTEGAGQNWIQQFQYDRYGNRTAFSQSIGAVQTTATPLIDPATNRFVTTNQNFRYDKNGNLTTEGDDRTVIFNGENKQHEVKNAAGQTIGQYLYDGEGKRVKKITWNTQGISETTVFVYSAGKLVAEYSNTQVPVTNPTTRYLTEDHLGTPRVITDSEGNVISRRDFLPFGEELAPSVGARASVAAYQPTNDNVKQKFTGYQKDDETGLDFAEARMYENRHGRFTAVDPLLASGKSANPQTFNRFVYCVNSPLGCVDPTGLDGERRWYSTTNPDILKEKCDSQCATFYQASEESPGENWNEVSFENRSYHVISGPRIDGGTRFLYADGTEDAGRRAMEIQRSILGMDQCVPSYQCAGLRSNPVSRQALADFGEGYGIGIRNELKAQFDLPNRNFGPALFPIMGPQVLNFDIRPIHFGVKPWFNYETPANQNQAAGEFAGRLSFNLAAGAGIGGAAAKVSGLIRASKTGEFIGPKLLEYAPRVRARALEDPVSHNFPFSFDNIILSNRPRVMQSGYKLFQQPGYLNGRSGVYEIGVNSDFIIDHRFFRSQ